jgi:uncharacterized protein involved in exopolysaccharide biosynthesis
MKRFEAEDIVMILLVGGFSILMVGIAIAFVIDVANGGCP